MKTPFFGKVKIKCIYNYLYIIIVLVLYIYSTSHLMPVVTFKSRFVTIPKAWIDSIKKGHRLRKGNLPTKKSENIKGFIFVSHTIRVWYIYLHW